MMPVYPSTVPAGYKVVIHGKDQKEYITLPSVMDAAKHEMITEWEPSGEELQHLFEGGRIRLTVMTFGQPLQPVKLETVPNAK